MGLQQPPVSLNHWHYSSIHLNPFFHICFEPLSTFKHKIKCLWYWPSRGLLHPHDGTVLDVLTPDLGGVVPDHQEVLGVEGVPLQLWDSGSHCTNCTHCTHCTYLALLPSSNTPRIMLVLPALGCILLLMIFPFLVPTMNWTEWFNIMIHLFTCLFVCLLFVNWRPRSVMSAVRKLTNFMSN